MDNIENATKKFTILLLTNRDSDNVGDQVIEASDGYARNFLFPKKLAVEANNENMSSK